MEFAHTYRYFGTDLCGNMVVLGIWDPCTMCVFEILVVDIDAVSYYWRHPFKILSQDKQRKNVKYIEACLER